MTVVIHALLNDSDVIVLHCNFRLNWSGRHTYLVRAWLVPTLVMIPIHVVSLFSIVRGPSHCFEQVVQ